MESEQKTILIVEDEVSLRLALKTKLLKEGFDVLDAADGEEGLQIALEDHPDLILLDIIMPVMDGMTMLGKLREDAWGKDARVIMLTNLTDEERALDAREHGTFDYLIKSDWKIEDLVKKIQERLAA